MYSNSKNLLNFGNLFLVQLIFNFFFSIFIFCFWFELHFSSIFFFAYHFLNVYVLFVLILELRGLLYVLCLTVFGFNLSGVVYVVPCYCNSMVVVLAILLMIGFPFCVDVLMKTLTWDLKVIVFNVWIIVVTKIVLPQFFFYPFYLLTDRNCPCVNCIAIFYKRFIISANVFILI